jgi:hypothetical protein
MTVSFRQFAGLAMLSGSLLMGCGGSSPTSPVVRDVAAARAKWQRAGIRNYEFVSTLSCFCAPDYTAAMKVTVQNGLVTAIANASTGATVPVSYRQPIDSIFANLERQAADNPSLLTVQFDPTYGYPVQAEFGSLAADAGYAVYLANLRPLP